MNPYRSSPTASPAERMPRDLGMSTLGLLMVVGAVLAGSLGVQHLLHALERVEGLGWSVPLISGVGRLARAAVGLWAGRRLMAGHPGGLRATRIAGAVALAHAVVSLVQFDPLWSRMGRLDLVAHLVTWPVVYLGLAHRPAVLALYRRAAGDPSALRTPDGGLDAVFVLGRASAIAGGLLLVTYAGIRVAISGAHFNVPADVVFAVVLVLLAVRSALHVHVLAAARRRDHAAFVARARTYRAACVAIAVVAAAAIAMGPDNVAAELRGFGSLFGLLLAWPLALGVLASCLERRMQPETNWRKLRVRRKRKELRPSDDAGVTAVGLALLVEVLLRTPMIVLTLTAPPISAASAVPLSLFVASAGLSSLVAFGHRRRRFALFALAAVLVLSSAISAASVVAIYGEWLSALLEPVFTVPLLEPLATLACGVAAGIAGYGQRSSTRERSASTQI